MIFAQVVPHLFLATLCQRGILLQPHTHNRHRKHDDGGELLAEILLSRLEGQASAVLSGALVSSRRISSAVAVVDGRLCARHHGLCALHNACGRLRASLVSASASPPPSLN